MKNVMVYSALPPEEDHSIHFQQDFFDVETVNTLELRTLPTTDCKEESCIAPRLEIVRNDGDGYMSIVSEVDQASCCPERSDSLENGDHGGETEDGDEVGETDLSRSETTPWLHQLTEVSLPEFHGQIPVPLNFGTVSDGQNVPWYRSLHAFLGVGSLIAVGYMDPGNWVTDLAGGSAYEYSLLFVIALSSVMAMFLQYLALKAGLATSRDLAQICRDSYPPSIVICLWIIMEIAICATGEFLSSCYSLSHLVYFFFMFTRCCRGSRFSHCFKTFVWFTVSCWSMRNSV
jgi:hypothetical protein